MSISYIYPNETPQVQPATQQEDASLETQLETLFQHPGPYTSVYRQTLPLVDEAQLLSDPDEGIRKSLREQHAPLKALEEISRLMKLKPPDDAAGAAYLVAADGESVVAYGHEPPRESLVYVSSLPYVAPVLEWKQRQVAHLVVVTDGVGADVAIFGTEMKTDLQEIDGSARQLADQILSIAADQNSDLIIVAGTSEGEAADLGRHIRDKLPIGRRLMIDSTIPSVEELTQKVVRKVSDFAARQTVEHLQELRFMEHHDAAVEGTSDTVKAMSESDASALLIHDDPGDKRSLWFGPTGTDISLEQTEICSTEGRMVDALIRSALLQKVEVRIIPQINAHDGLAQNVGTLTIDSPAKTE